ncbi:MAG TPA: EAL domain-containing protein [Candidatus Dormibacteraeota bacterium]|nr:EAL domain-containing protein [Candidatus Dormibacteraeota bacterium]
MKTFVAAVAALGVAGGVAAAFLPSPDHVEIPWWLIAAGYAAATGLVVHVHLNRDAHTVTLAEIPLTMGLCLAAPRDLLLGAAVGTAAALFFIRHQPPLKLVFNLSLHVGAAAACLGVLRLAGAGLDPLALRNWPAIVASTFVLSGLGGALLVATAMRLGGDRSAFSRSTGVIYVTLTACVLNTVVGLAGARLISTDGVVAVLLAVPCLACVVTYSLYTKEHSERTRLSLLYDSARAFAGAHDTDAVVRTLLMRARELLRAERAELLLLPADSDGDMVRVRLDAGGSALVHAIDSSEVTAALAVPQGRRLARGTRDASAAAALAALDARDAVVVPLRGEAGSLGSLAVLDRCGDVATFGSDDLALLETFAGQAATSLSHARVSAELHELAYHDALTGLANRPLLIRRVEAALARPVQRSGDAFIAMAYIDLDDFKTVNDSLGHTAGDRLLVEIATRIRSALRSADLAARLGGDEFAVVLDTVQGPEEAATIIERLLLAIRRPINLDGVRLSAGASAGVVVVARDSGVDATTLLSHADVAMYRAKARGKGRAELFEPSMQARVHERHRLKVDLESAIRESRLSVAYQPIVQLGGGSLVGAEALVRWNHPQRGPVAPDEFIPLAEETGLIHQLGARVLRTACADAASWQAARPGLTVAVNVSGFQLRDQSFPAAVAAVLEATGLDARLLTLEVTESVMVTDDSELRQTLRLLRDLGCRLAIDDFGTGYSSLASLRELPVQTLKIAKPFVDGLGLGREQDAFAEAIVGLGRTLGLTTVAEGIETVEQARRLDALTCTLGQGYLFSKALSSERFAALLA